MKAPDCNLKYHKCNPVIPKGYTKCYSCKGTGVILVSIHYKNKYLRCHSCPVCFGEGVIDWVTSITKIGFEESMIGLLSNYKKYLKLRNIYLPLNCPTNKKCKVIKKLIKSYNKFLKEERNWRKYREFI